MSIDRKGSYWRFVKAHDHAGFLALWNDRFVGWPIFASRPLVKANPVDGIALLHEDPERVYDYRLEKEAVRGFDDIVVTHYLYWDIWRADRGVLYQNT
jgi:hypothetical protein